MQTIEKTQSDHSKSPSQTRQTTEQKGTCRRAGNTVADKLREQMIRQPRRESDNIIFAPPGSRKEVRDGYH